MWRVTSCFVFICPKLFLIHQTLTQVEKFVVGRRSFPFWNGPFLGDVLVLGGVFFFSRRPFPKKLETSPFWGLSNSWYVERDWHHFKIICKKSWIPPLPFVSYKKWSVDRNCPLWEKYISQVLGNYSYKESNLSKSETWSRIFWCSSLKQWFLWVYGFQNRYNKWFPPHKSSAWLSSWWFQIFVLFTAIPWEMIFFIWVYLGWNHRPAMNPIVIVHYLQIQYRMITTRFFKVTWNDPPNPGHQ